MRIWSALRGARKALWFYLPRTAVDFISIGVYVVTILWLEMVVNLPENLAIAMSVITQFAFYLAVAEARVREVREDLDGESE